MAPAGRQGFTANATTEDDDEDTEAGIVSQDSLSAGAITTEALRELS